MRPSSPGSRSRRPRWVFIISIPTWAPLPLALPRRAAHHKLVVLNASLPPVSLLSLESSGFQRQVAFGEKLAWPATILTSLISHGRRSRHDSRTATHRGSHRREPPAGDWGRRVPCPGRAEYRYFPDILGKARSGTLWA